MRTVYAHFPINMIETLTLLWISDRQGIRWIRVPDECQRGYRAFEDSGSLSTAEQIPTLRSSKSVALLAARQDQGVAAVTTTDKVFCHGRATSGTSKSLPNAGSSAHPSLNGDDRRQWSNQFSEQGSGADMPFHSSPCFDDARIHPSLHHCVPPSSPIVPPIPNPSTPAVHVRPVNRGFNAEWV
ncbi:hypothetical protein NMY22_g18787 [Coprinellus aureogranulatus]|nr:hypothetical protein NMY22_g18787 [Coprinellus aureogranulatus]